MQSIPKLDLSHFTEGSAEQKVNLLRSWAMPMNKLDLLLYAIIVFHQTH